MLQLLQQTLAARVQMLRQIQILDAEDQELRIGFARHRRRLKLTAREQLTTRLTVDRNHDGADVVGRAALVGEAYQVLDDGGGRFGLFEQGADLVGVDDGAEAVAAQKIAIASYHAMRPNGYTNLRAHTEGTRDDVLRQPPELLLVEFGALLEHVGEQRMVLG